MFRRLLILLCLLIPVWGFSQNLSGIWKGFFSTGFGNDKQYYKYEAQIVLDGQAVSGVAYSYLNKTFYGKSQLGGAYNATAKKLEANETKLVSFSNSNSSNVCLMHSKLSYFKRGTKDILEGTFSSVNSVTGADCSSGYVYLEKSTNSDFYAEPFLAKGKKKNIAPPKNSAVVKNNKPKPFNTIISSPKTAIAETPKSESMVTSTMGNNNNLSEVPNAAIASFSNIPDNFQHRKNKLVKTIVTHTPEVDIDFYDNGEIDDDSITVYHNLRPIIEHGRLSRQPIDYGFDASDSNRLQSFIIVADNLGKIPPNSALMVIYTNHQRYEVFIESDLKNNGEVRIVYEPVAVKSGE